MAFVKWGAWVLTAVVTAGAATASWMVYCEEVESPWTRDGQVVADLIPVVSPVSGVVERVEAISGDRVEPGAILFSLMREPLEAALENARAALKLSEAREVRFALMVRDGRKSMTRGAWEKLLAEYQEARAQKEQDGRRVQTLENHLDECDVRAPSGAYVMQCGLQSGTFVRAGESLFSLAVADSFRIMGFFRETLIRHVKRGDRAEVVLMAYPEMVLSGVVETVERGIARRNGTLDSEMLPEVTPTFDWIRLAQRIPVVIRLENVPPDVELRVGLTASVRILDSRS